MPIVPHTQFEIRGTEKTEEVGLVHMLVRPAGDAGVSRRDVGHGRKKVGSNFVISKQFAEPTAPVVEFPQIADDDILYFAGLKSLRQWRRLLQHVSSPNYLLRFQRPGSTRGAGFQRCPRRSTNRLVRPRSSLRGLCRRC